MFASQTTTTIAMPDGSGSITIRKLTGKEFEAAQQAAIDVMAGGGRRVRGFSATMRRLLEKDPTVTEAETKAALADPLTGFDRFAVIAAGLTAWTHGRELKAGIDDLDDEAAEFIGREILRLTKPSLFQTVEEREAATKNG
jgi:hypothetical protein